MAFDKKDTTNYVALYSTSTAFFLPDFPEFQLFRSLKLLPQFQRFQTCSNQTILAPGSRAAPSSRTRWYSGSMRFLRAARVSSRYCRSQMGRDKPLIYKLGHLIRCHKSAPPIL